MKLQHIILPGFLLFSSHLLYCQTDLPKVYTFNPGKIYSAKLSYTKGELKKNEIVNKLIKDANKLLNLEPLSVMEKGQIPPSGNKHDYLSMAPYWWPDPNSKDGLPYIRKDGQRNPEIKNIPDDDNKSKVIKSVETLSLAYYITNDSKYSTKAAQLLRVFFLNDDTKMNPNLNFAQYIPGRNDGRGAGIIETHELPRLIDALGLLETSKEWTKEDDSKLKKWFEDYLDWLLNSSNGKSESKAKNNHGSWYDGQVVSVSLFLGKTDLAKKYLEDAKTKRINLQIQPDGKQPLELVRTASWSYSVFNLAALFQLAEIGDKLNVDLWNYVNPDGGSIRKAFDFVLPASLDHTVWQTQQIKDFKTNDLYPLLILARKNFENKTYSDWIEKIFGSKMNKDLSNILY